MKLLTILLSFAALTVSAQRVNKDTLFISINSPIKVIKIGDVIFDIVTKVEIIKQNNLPPFGLINCDTMQKRSWYTPYKIGSGLIDSIETLRGSFMPNTFYLPQ